MISITKALSLARQHCSRSRWSGKRIARNAAVVLGVSFLCSHLPPPNIFIMTPFLVEWLQVSVEKKRAEELLPEGYSKALAGTKRHFLAAYPSTMRIIRNSVLAAAFINYSPFEPEDFNFLSWVSASAGIYLGAFALVDAVRARRARRKGNPTQLLDNLVRASLDAHPNTIAQDLSSSSRWGWRKLARGFLLKLKEADGTKFGAVIAALNASRRGKSLAERFVYGRI